MSNKGGRNDPCPCGSGKKYKKCHGGPTAPSFTVREGPPPEAVRKRMEEHQAAEMQRQQQPATERHPLPVWYETGTRYMNRLMSEPGKVHIAPMTGAVAAYLGLAYNL